MCPPDDADRSLEELRLQNRKLASEKQLLQRRNDHLEARVGELERAQRETAEARAKLQGELAASGVKLAELKRKLESRGGEVAAAAREHRSTIEREARAREDLIAFLGHELRTPLNSILGYAELLHEEAQDAGQTRAAGDLKRVCGAARQLLSVVSDALELARAESKSAPFYVETVSIAAMLEDACTIVRSSAQSRGVTLSVKPAGDLGTIRVDGERARRALAALLGHVIGSLENEPVSVEARRDASRTSTPPPGGALEFAVSEGRVVVQVSAPGLAYSAAQLERALGSSGRQSPWAARTSGASGLGLTLCRQLCVLMGGDLTATSDLGRGTSFFLVLPLDARPATGPLRAVTEEP